jgi:hypothetical protein
MLTSRPGRFPSAEHQRALLSSSRQWVSRYGPAVQVILFPPCVGEQRPAGSGSDCPGLRPESLCFLLALDVGECSAWWVTGSVSAWPGARVVCIISAEGKPTSLSSVNSTVLISSNFG